MRKKGNSRNNSVHDEYNGSFFRYTLNMRTAALVLVLTFGGLQMVAFADCCCMDECAQRPVQETSCGNCDSPEGDAPQENQGSPNCLHVQPSSDVVSHAQDAVVIPEPTIVGAVEPVPISRPSWRIPAEADGYSRESRGRPLFLLNSAFLI